MGWSWWNPCCWFGYCTDLKCCEAVGPGTSGFVTETCAVLTLLVVLKILAKLERGIPLHQVTDDAVETGDGVVGDDLPPPAPPPSGIGPWIPPVASNVVQDLILHQFRREDEAPLGIGPLQLETVMRILDLSYRVELDARSVVFISIGEKILSKGTRACLDLVKKLTTNKGHEWDVPQELEVPARFLLNLLRGEFPALVALYTKGFWKDGAGVVTKSKLIDPYELELAGKLTKVELLEEIETSLKALNGSIGDKKFFIGNQLSVVDGFAFGILAQLTWSSDEDLLRLIRKFPQLVAFTELLRERIWKDWNPPLPARVPVSPRTSPSMTNEERHSEPKGSPADETLRQDAREGQ